MSPLRAARSRCARVLRGGGGRLLLSLLSACKSSPDAEPARDDRTTVIALSATPVNGVPPARLRHGIEECKPLARTRCDVREDPCQQRLFELARCVSARGGERPPLRFAAQTSVAPEDGERSPRNGGRPALARALTVLGLGEAPASDAERRPGALSASAYYAPRERAVYLASDEATAPADEAAALSLVHEYVHALQDHDGELLAAQNSSAERTFDEELALWSRFEGEATLHEEVVRAFSHDRDASTWLTQRFASRTDGSDGAIARQRRPLEASFATFPYTYGAYAAALAAEPALSTHQLMGVRHDWTPSDAERCDGIRPASLTAAQTIVARDTLGAWLVQSYVRRATSDPERARDTARRWRGDHMALYASDPSATPSFTWQTCWDSAETALELREVIAAQLRERVGERASVTSDGQRVTAIVRDDGR